MKLELLAGLLLFQACPEEERKIFKRFRFSANLRKMPGDWQKI